MPLRPWSLLTALLLLLPSLAAAQAAPPASPRAPGGRGLAGLWFGVGEAWSMSGRPTKTVGVQLLTLYPDGRALKTAPYEGLAVPFDFDARCGKDTPCGTYTVRGDAVHVSWATGRQEEYRREGADGLHLVRGFWREYPDKVSSERRAYRRLDRLQGLRPAGEYAFVDHEGKPAEAITFTADGRFSERGLVARTSTLTVPSEEQRRREALGLRQGQGRYHISDNTLELRYDGGQVLRFVILVAPGTARQPAPRSIRVNGVELVRQG